jgi:hypothetical protein
MVTPIRQRRTLVVALVSAAALWPAGALADQSGTLIAHGTAEPASSFTTSFHQVRPASVFWLVVSETSRENLVVSWSIHCFNSPRREGGGAAGEATVNHGRWIKPVRADWIKHPALCSGTVGGAAAGSPVTVRIYASRP